MKKVLLGMVLTLGIMWAFGMAFLGNNIKIERVEQTHNRTIIEDGKVVEHGSMEELLKNEKQFAELYKIQQEGLKYIRIGD